MEMPETVNRRPIGETIRHLREKKGWSLTALAERAGVSRSYLYQIEQGESTPTEDKIQKLAGALGARPSELLGEQIVSPVIPQSLQQFADEAKLGSAEIQMLAQIEYRGRRPSTSAEWKAIYAMIKAMLEK